MTAKFRLAVVGAGRAGLVHAHNAVLGLGVAELACIVDADEGARAHASGSLGVPGFTGLAEALDGAPFDGVVLTTPTHTHADLAVMAAEAGKHVFCEKPMALTVHECDRMAAAADRAAVVLQVGFVRRFQPEFVAAKRRIDQGAIGLPMLVKSLTRGPGLPPSWALELERSNGMLAEVNSHDFDSARWLAGSEIQRVYAEVANVKGAQRGVAAPDFYDNAVVSLRFASGALGTVDGTCPADYGYDARVEVVGTEGLLVVGGHQAVATLELRERGHGEVPVWASWAQRFETGYREELVAFVTAAREGAPAMVGAADGRAAVAAVVAANRSWKTGAPVNVPGREA